MRRLFIILSALLLAFGIVGTGTAFYIFNLPVTTEVKESVFEVKPGSLASTAKRLEEAGLIRSEFQFRILARLTGSAGKVRIGEYRLFTNMTPTQILDVVSSGKSIQRSVTIPEGDNLFEVALQVERAGIAKGDDFVKLCFDKGFLRKHLDEQVESCEGYLFPETYNYTKYTTLEALVGEMLEMFKEKFKTLGDGGAKFGLNRNQVVTLASIIEKETGADEERALVSSVYHNRLKLKMRLQADPTTLYGKMMKSHQLEKNITHEDLKAVNRYNTYAMAGLPIGPIANPGLRSLQAAVNPAQSEYLYFVSQNDGKHVFSKDFKSHNSAVGAFQKNPSARKGKSWRDLKKKRPGPKSVRTH